MTTTDKAKSNWPSNNFRFKKDAKILTPKTAKVELILHWEGTE